MQTLCTVVPLFSLHELLKNLRILISKSPLSIEICSVALLQSRIIIITEHVMASK